MRQGAAGGWGFGGGGEIEAAPQMGTPWMGGTSIPTRLGSSGCICWFFTLQHAYHFRVHRR